MHHTFNENKWKWFDYENGDQQKLRELVSNNPEYENWFENINDSKTNLLELDTQTRGKEYIWGSLIYQQDIEDKGQKNIFHFWISRDFFILVDFDFAVLNANPVAVHKQMDQAENAVEGFFIILGEILASYLQKIDGYEERLHDLLWEMKEHNNREILEKIYENRHELLVWKNMVIPIVELRFIAEEAYGREMHKKTEFSRVVTRVERIRTLLDEYQHAIDTMVNLEEVVSTHRGNEIMKTLTVMTILFTPVTAWGAVWGMNFKVMPELEWKFGYAFAGVLILASTVGIYYYLKKKGWMGDILRVKKKNRFFG
ncbi:magnesium transporter CorA family protein [Mesobacillus selenatarsenatis]|uniref:Magnesium and cobalt transport protein CorA n=1 Tax=Mesobacillus selenatarsenatis (strain DSM 18680 / JCM 14380 / FERM P-15431 / SF-1) TaxID=1321606 RepID=A0A0A8WZW8_MESS1|nr:magnesium transporter CorA family protein [Mesobacillus selenatarsenatis]GAM12519.1 magnesium and cobalt transport protein CorA [Mesobacillus selenatarsenatis SF-1]